MPVSNLALTTARRLPKRAAVVGIWNRSLVGGGGRPAAPLPEAQLTANRRPFLYFPLRHHFEQNFHVARAGPLPGGPADGLRHQRPATIAAAITAEIGRTVDNRLVETDGATRAASLIAELV
jgi:hypothetical protein